MSGAFWSGKRVFLTGHTGFKGGWLALWLTSLGAEVKGYALAPAGSPNLFGAASIAGTCESEIGDLRDLTHLSRSMQAFRPDVVFHLAAQALVRESYVNPVDNYATNVMGTVHVLEAARAIESLQAVVVVTTDKCYENREWHWGYRETEPMGGHDPYSASKACAELVTSSYRRSFLALTESRQQAVAVASARAGNVIGGGDWSVDRLVPDIIRSLVNGQDIVIRNPDSVRPWQHVLDPLAGYMRLAELLCTKGQEYAEAWNFGPDERSARPVRWIVEKMIELWDTKARWVSDAAEQPHEARMLKLDISKARDRLAWNPVWELDQALAAVVDWHREYRETSSMQAACLAHIARYTADAERVEERGY